MHKDRRKYLVLSVSYTRPKLVCRCKESYLLLLQPSFNHDDDVPSVRGAIIEARGVDEN